NAEHPAAALEQEPVELGVVLIRLAAEERLDMQAVRVGDQPGHRDELVLSFEPDQERARLRRGEADAETGQDLAKPGAGITGLGRSGRPTGLPVGGHASTVAATRLMASPYTASS